MIRFIPSGALESGMTFIHADIYAAGSEWAHSPYRSRFKTVFCPELGVAPSPQVLDILEYVCGLMFGRALISNQNPGFAMGSKHLQRIRGNLNKLFGRIV